MRLELLHGPACGLGAEKGFAVADRHRANRRAQFRHGLNRIAGFLTLRRHEGKDHGKGTVELAHNEDIAPPAGFAAIDERRYGAAKIVILKRTP